MKISRSALMMGMIAVLLFSSACTTVPIPVQAPQTQPLAVKVLTLAMFEVGDVRGDFAGEAQLWIEGEEMDREIEIPGSFSPLYCNAEDHCLAITGMGIANATATMMAIGLSDQLDLSDTYVIIAGIAGTPPDDATLGSAAWAEWVIDGDLAHQIDAREIPETWEYPYFHLGCAEPWCDEGWSAGTEVFQLNADLVNAAFELSKDVELFDTEAAAAYRANYPEGTAASQPPSVLKCDSFASSTYWHGERLSDWAEWWSAQWSGGSANYCMTNMEDSGTLTALMRLADTGRIDPDRVLVLRTASNFDQPYPGQTAAESIDADSGGFVPSIQNAYRVGSPVARHIIQNWETWQAGVPEQ
jgi:purine nucleoside permease